MAPSPESVSLTRHTITLLTTPGQVVEVRALGIDGRNRIDSGYFDSAEAAALAVAKVDGRADGIYVTLNPCNPALLARAANRIKEWAKVTTSDRDIEHRTWMLIDADPVRPKDISSTDAEHEAALQRACEIREWLAIQGWPEPILADSGNGGHLLYRIDLPNDQDSADIIKQCLEALALHFDDSAITVDRKNFNASRITKLYGTMARKGDHTADRPHRRSTILEAPESVSIVDVRLLRALANRVPKDQKPEHYYNGNGHSPISNIEAWLDEHRIAYKVKAWGADTIYQLDECPFNSDHGRDSYVVRRANGMLGFGCFHNGCSGNHWQEFRARIDPKPAKPEPAFDEGVACCPQHHTPLIKAKNGNGWRCEEYNCFWWAGEGYAPPHTVAAANVAVATSPVAATVTKKEPEYTTMPSAPMGVNDMLALPRKPPLWYAPSFLREGFGMIVGQPNVGKTPLVIQLGVALATGTHWMNTVQCRKSRVLFLGTEYTKQELIPIVDESLYGMQVSNEYLAFKTIDDDDIAPRTADDAIAMLDYFIRVLGYEVIIIDVMTGFLPSEGFKQNVYRGDYTEFKPYHKLALHYNAAILGTWHASKREADPRLMYNGSTGMWAVPASRMSMYTDQDNRVRLFSMPRFCEKLDWALAQQKTHLGRRWVVGDVAPEPVLTSTQEQTIYRWLRDNSDKANPKTPATVAEMVAMPGNTVRSVLSRMFEKNVIHKTATGNAYYVVAPVALVAPVASVADVAPPEEAQQAQQVVAPLLRSDTASGSAKTAAQQTQHDFQRNNNNGSATGLKRSDFSVEVGVTASGQEVVTLFYDPTGTVIGRFDTEAEALAEVQRRVNGGA